MTAPLLVTLLWLSALAAWSLGIFLLARAKSVTLRYFALQAVATGLYAGGYGLELSAGTLPEMQLASRLQYIGIVLMPAAGAVFCLNFTGMTRYATPALRVLYWAIPALTILFKIFDEKLHLIYANVEVEPVYNTLLITPGPWYYLNLAYAYLCGGVGLTALLLHAFRHGGIHRRQALTLALFPVVVIGASLVNLSHLNPFGALDLAAISMTPCIFILYFVVLRLKIVDLAPVAYGWIVEHMPEGILVFDRNRRLCEANESARAFLALGPERTGDDASKILGMELAVKALPEAGRNSFPTVLNGRDFEVRTTILSRESDERLGWIVTLTDTGDRHREELLRSQTASRDEAAS